MVSVRERHGFGAGYDVIGVWKGCGFLTGCDVNIQQRFSGHQLDSTMSFAAISTRSSSLEQD